MSNEADRDAQEITGISTSCRIGSAPPAGLDLCLLPNSALRDHELRDPNSSSDGRSHTMLGGLKG
jgi:hypothetical protein